MNLKIIALALAMLLGASTLSAQTPPPPPSPDASKVTPGAYVLDKNHGKITWSISHLGFSTYVGQFTDVDAKLMLNPQDFTKTTVEATINIASIATSNPKLDEHLKSPDFFNVEKFPTATFKQTSIARTGPSTATVNGTLTLLGVSKPVTLDLTFNLAGFNAFKQYVAGFTGTTKIKRSDFGMTKFLPYLGDDVTLTIEGEFNPAS